MLRDDQRLCDICDAVIPRGVTYRRGFTTPGAVADWFDDAPELRPSFTTEPDGTVRIEVCAVCAASERMSELTEDAVDVLQ